MAMTTTSFWRRRRAWIFFAVLVAPIFCIFLLTRSFLLSPIIESSLSATLDTDVKVSGAQWNWDGTVDMEEVILHANGIEGLAADVVSIHDVTIELNSAFPIFGFEINSIEIDSIHVRLAESTVNAGEFNFSKLFSLPSTSNQQNSSNSKSAKNETVVPHVSLQKLIVETGVMNSGKFSIENSEVFSIQNAEHDDSKMVLHLIGEEDSLNLKVEITTLPLEVIAEVNDVQLDHKLFKLLPKTAKTWCEEIQLQGGVKTLDASWNAIEGVKLAASVEELKFQLPEKHGVPWAVYKNGVVKEIHGDASLDVSHGIIMYDDQQVLLKEIQGLLVPPQQDVGRPLEFSADMKIYNFGSVGDKEGEEWMDSMLSKSPFKATFTINDFTPSKVHPGEVCVPLAAAQMLKLFQLEDWEMNAKVSVARAVQDSEVEVVGDLLIEGATGMYEGFPYPLEDIKSLIKFKQETANIVYLNAVGREGAPVHISGEVITEKDYLVVDLNLDAQNAPLDEKLHDAVSEQIATVMDRLLDFEAYERVVDSLNQNDGNEFDLGGAINLDLRIQHDSRVDDDTTLSGSIDFENVGIVHGEFPYPVVLKSGNLSLDPKGLHVPDDSVVKFEGNGGGKGVIAGSILFREDGSTVPVLAIDLENEWVTATLVEAASDSAGEAYKVAADVLSGLGLSSMLNLHGTVMGKDDGKLDIQFDIQIEDGVSVPNARLAEAIHVSGPFWPEDFEFTGVEADIVFDNGAISMSGVTCQCGTGSLEASMSIDKGEFDLDIRGQNLPFNSRFVKVLPSNSSEKLSGAWQWLEPTGVMDAVIRMSHDEEQSTLRMQIEPEEFIVSGVGRQSVLTLELGEIIVEGTNVFLNGLNFTIFEGETSQGVLEIDGEVHGEESDFGYSIHSKWEDVDIDSPLTRAITGIVGGEQGVQYFDSIQPSGHATATLFADGDGDELTYTIEVIPSNLSATFNERRAVAEFGDIQDASNNIIRFNNEGIHFDQLSGELGSGSFSLDGKISSIKEVNGIFDLAWIGPTGDESLFAILPRAVGDTLIAIKVKDGKSVLPNGKLMFEGKSWSELAVTFLGDITFESCSIDVGIPLEQINGVTHVYGEYSKEHLDTLELSIAFDELTTLGRVISDVTGSLEFDPTEQLFAFEELRGETSTGSVSVKGWISTQEEKEYAIEILIAGVELARDSKEDESENIVASLEGELKGWISIAGNRGDSASRRGVGKIQVENGHLEIEPFSMTTMRLLQLSLPTAATISGADIELYIDGDQIILEDISLRSNESDISDFVLEGEGTVDFETFQLNARLHPRAGLPIIRDIAGALNDQLYSIDVKGDLLDPEVSVVPLPFLSPQKK